MEKVLFVGAGGFIGAAMRYGLSVWIGDHVPVKFPLATFIINVTGCALIGLVLTLAAERETVSPNMRLFLATGILGGYTTFSTFGYETVELMRQDRTLLAASYAAGSVVLGVAGVILGRWIARQI
ncbi:fluoride efflux transporter CrcB [Candidatus Sumerlaeota bacterium]|nr:fluoride efflux transporter CrcB [Candidatus Sumerlaeota bacterium]